MKKTFLLLVILISSSSFSQSNATDEVALLQDIYGKSKTDLVNQYMNLSEPQATAFKKIYDEYEVERKALGQKKIQLINDYANSYATLDDAKAAELTETNLKNNAASEKLLCKTFKKAKKAIGGLNAAKFVQLEQYLQVTIRAEIQDSIPFIDEIDKTKIAK
jgi:ATP-dependent protease HslVU (ClpYQ) ATPase subunit